MQSTGTPLLDRSAVAAFQHWLFKPGKWKWVDEPMWFESDPPVKKMTSQFIHSPFLPPDAVELAADEHPDPSDYYAELPKSTPVTVPLGYKPVRVFQTGRFIGWTYMSEESIAELHAPE
jgi:hypothetical protein